MKITRKFINQINKYFESHSNYFQLSTLLMKTKLSRFNVNFYTK